VQPAVLPANGLEPIQGRLDPAPPRLGVVIQPPAVLDRHQHGDRAVVAFDQETLTGGCGVQDGAEGSTQVKGRDGSHSQPS